MKFLYSWINEFVDAPEDVESLADALTMAGLEVEGIEQVGDDISGITTGKILSIKKHPDADKLVICDVTDGKTNHQIVTGANNISEGDVVPVSLPGAVVKGGMKIKSSKLRGVDSHGMLCSEKELGVSDEATGIWILDPETPLGIDFIDYALLKDSILDIAILPNRGDCQSILGLAREIAALTGKPLKNPDISFKTEAIKHDFTVSVKNPELCPLYTGRYLTSVKNGQSPLQMQRRLQLSGIRPISLIVDISNYVLLEMGHPLHTFDADKCKSKQFTVEVAGSKKSLTTLDDEKRDLQKEQLVICNGDDVVAAAGVMGAKNSEVSDETNTVFLEAAYFDPMHIRRSSQKLGLRTDSSIRFEKGINIETVDLASQRAAQLLQDLAGASVSDLVISEKDDSNDLFKAKSIQANFKQINDFLGSNFSDKEMSDILTNLGFSISKDSVTIPSWRRQDIEAWPCLAEEIARLKGFDAIPSTPISDFVELQNSDDNLNLTEKSQDFFVTNGFSELCTYPMISKEEAARFDAEHISDRTELANPITPELAVMRSSLLPSHLNIHKHHSTRQMPESAFFEVANGYIGETEKNLIAASIRGSLYETAYVNAQRDIASDNFDQLKAAVQRYFSSLRVNVSFQKNDAHDWAHPHYSADILTNGKTLGRIQLLHPRLLKDYDISEPIAYMECDLDLIQASLPGKPVYKAFSSFPSTRRDVALLAPKDLSYDDILKTIQKFKHKSVQEVFMFDLFESDKLKDNHQSIAFALIYQDMKGTLSDDKVNRAHENLCNQLSKHLPVSIR